MKMVAISTKTGWKYTSACCSLHFKRTWWQCGYPCLQEGDDKPNNGTSANKIPTLNLKTAAPKTSVRASQSLRKDLLVDPQPSPIVTNNSTPQLQPVNLQTNVSAVQPLPSPSPSDVLSSQCHQPFPPQNNTKASHIPMSSHKTNELVPEVSHMAPDLTRQLSFLLER